jgi:hypothetical protein
MMIKFAPKCALCGAKEDLHKLDGTFSNYYGIREIGGRQLCDTCTRCRNCRRGVRKPRRTHPLCKSCLKEQAKKIATRLHSHETFSAHAASKSLSLGDISTKRYKLYPFIRFEKISLDDARCMHHNGTEVPVIEVGMFFNATSKTWERMSQIGVAKITNPNDGKPKLKGTFMRVHTVFMPDIGDNSWHRREARERIDRYTEHLRKLGWRVVAVRGERGHRSWVSGYDSMTWDEEQAEIARQNFDKNMGRRHVQTLERIDKKYDKNEQKLDSASAWIGETVHNSVEAA